VTDKPLPQTVKGRQERGKTNKQAGIKNDKTYYKHESDVITTTYANG